MAKGQPGKGGKQNCPKQGGGHEHGGDMPKRKGMPKEEDMGKRGGRKTK